VIDMSGTGGPVAASDTSAAGGCPCGACERRRAAAASAPVAAAPSVAAAPPSASTVPTVPAAPARAESRARPEPALAPRKLAPSAARGGRPRLRALAWEWARGRVPTVALILAILAIGVGAVATLGVPGSDPPSRTAAAARPSTAGSGSASGPAAPDPARTAAAQTVASPATKFGQAVDVGQNGHPSGTMVVDRPSPAAQVTGVTPAGGKYLSFRVTVRAQRDGMVYNPLYFSVIGPDGTRYAPVVGGGREPRLDPGVLPARSQVSGFVTFEAPVRGTLVYAPGPSAPTARWSYAG
jgi:hypothetical protein